MPAWLDDVCDGIPQSQPASLWLPWRSHFSTVGM
jgi:hypothetical protein